MSLSERPQADESAYLLDDQIGYLLRLANQRHNLIFVECLKDEGLTPTQFSTLLRLAEAGPCSQNLLGRLIAVDVATIKGVVERLAAKDLVTLSADPEDRRRTRIDLSETGRAMIPRLHLAGAGITEETLAPLGARERTQLLRLIRKIV